MDDFNLGICSSRVRDINLCVWSIPRSGGVAFSERLRKRGDSVIWTEGQFWVRGSGYVMRIPLLAWLIPSSLNGARLRKLVLTSAQSHLRVPITLAGETGQVLGLGAKRGLPARFLTVVILWQTCHEMAEKSSKMSR